jgi:hypothetical protein
MATHATAIPTVGELRFIYRLNRASVDRGPTASDVRGCDTVVEGSDVFKCADGSIHTKFFSSTQFIDDQVHGVTGSGVGAWMVMPGTAYEHSSGGPFFRYIQPLQSAATWPGAYSLLLHFTGTSTTRVQHSRNRISICIAGTCKPKARPAGCPARKPAVRSS